MSDRSDLLASLAMLRVAGLTMSEAWHQAHEIAQRHEGEAAFDRVHAFLHRIEGDAFNAGYWYRRAGVERFPGSLEKECASLEALLT